MGSFRIRERDLAMAELKTKRNKGNVETFLNNVSDEKKRQDSFKILELMKQITGKDPEMWGDSIVGFGIYRYKSGRSGEWFKVGFSPRKQNLSVYLMEGFSKYDDLLQKFGKYKMGKSCLYINKLDDIDQDVLKELIKLSYTDMTDKYD